MTRLSVNVNKVATLRNARGREDPDVVEAVGVCVAAGAHGITVHPRADARHITFADVRAVAERLGQPDAAGIEFNIEGDPRPDWVDLVEEVQPAQATLVPVRPGEITSEAGWRDKADAAALSTVVARFQQRGIRVSLFVDPDSDPIRLARVAGADRVELYTEPFATAYQAGEAQANEWLSRYRGAADLAHALGLGVNAGHDLNLDNLPLFCTVPHLDEVSIGHALISRALFVGLDRAVREYLAVLP